MRALHIHDDTKDDNTIIDFASRNEFRLLGAISTITLSETFGTFWSKVEGGQQEGASIQTEQGGGNSKWSMTFRSESTVTDLGGLEGNDHVGSRSKHGQISCNGCRERDLQPIVRSSIWERGSKHLTDRYVGSNVGQNSDNHDEPVHTGTFSHLVGALAHTQGKECLRNTCIVERSNEEELSNEKHEKTVIDFGQSGLRLSDKLFLFRFNLVTIHIVGLLGWKRIALGIILGVVGAGVVMLTFVGSDNHKNGSGGNGNNANIESKSEEDQKGDHNNDLDLGPESPSAASIFWFSFFGSSLASVVGVFLSQHFRCSVTKEHDSEVFHDTRGSREEFRSVVDENHDSIDDGGGSNRQKHVTGEFQPTNVIVGKGNNQNVLRVSSQSQRRTNVGGGGQGQQIRKRVGNLVADAQIDNNTREDQDDRVVHDGSRSDGGHGHDLGRSLPVDRIIQGITELVKKSSTFHLLEVNGGKHETEKKEKRFQDDNSFGVKVRPVSSDLKDVTPYNHRKTTSKSNTGTSNRKEPVGEHEEDPVSKVNDRHRPLSKRRELVGNINVNIFSKVSVATASVL
mmetsp:Transcript_20399/g.38160  ORF Transcript_20399/g.38160 Transcript_20399/m.38160 type:complete len:568 (-) Transcript_20399:392-2095(-)